MGQNLLVALFLLLSDFKVLSELGHGHYCVTYVARDLKRGVDVVLKSLKEVRVPKVWFWAA